MKWLDTESLKAWYSRLPDDIASSMETPENDIDIDLNEISDEFAKIQTGAELVSFVEKKSQMFVNIGRPRRIRFLAWLSSSTYSDKIQALQILTGDEDVGGSNGDIGKVVPYFKEDIRALVESLGPRVAKKIINSHNLNMAKDAGLNAMNELKMGA